MSKTLKSGLFISFEGGEGSGKTTQINKLAGFLSDRKYAVVTTREPGGTTESEKIRDLIVQKTDLDWSPLAEVLLVLAARVMHVQKVIKPALDDGAIVICDRFTDSTMAYQGYGRGLPLETIRNLTKDTLGDFAPALTFMLDIDPKEGVNRAENRIKQGGLMAREDRFESMETGFHERIRQGFLDIAKAEPGRCRLMNAAIEPDALAEKIAAMVIKHIEGA